MVEKMRAEHVPVVFHLALFVVCGSVFMVGAASIEEQCASEFQKVADCLSYSTGKAATPTKECCSSVTEIKSSHPVCLCYFILQTHKGTEPTIKNLGIQEARLLQLPSACKLVNSSISDCPKLLTIPASSPDYSIFTNSSSLAAPAATPRTSSPVKAGSISSGFKHGPHLAAAPMVIAVVFFFYAFPVGFASAFYIGG